MGTQPPRTSRAPLFLGIVGLVVVLLVVGVVVYLVLGGDEEAQTSVEDYCAVLDESYEDFDEIITGGYDAEDLVAASGVIGDISATAPDEVADEWTAYDDAFQTLEGALEAADFSLAELGAAQSANDVPDEAFAAADAFGAEIETIKGDGLIGRINEHARTECRMDLIENRDLG